MLLSGSPASQWAWSQSAHHRPSPRSILWPRQCQSSPCHHPLTAISTAVSLPSISHAAGGVRNLPTAASSSHLSRRGQRAPLHDQHYFDCPMFLRRSERLQWCGRETVTSPTHQLMQVGSSEITQRLQSRPSRTLRRSAGSAPHQPAK